VFLIISPCENIGGLSLYAVQDSTLLEKSQIIRAFFAKYFCCFAFLFASGASKNGEWKMTGMKRATAKTRHSPFSIFHYPFPARGGASKSGGGGRIAEGVKAEQAIGPEQVCNQGEQRGNKAGQKQKTAHFGI
jgi:hypothetical protein